MITILKKVICMYLKMVMLKAECVVTDEGNGILEIKNIAVDVVMLLCMYQLK